MNNGFLTKIPRLRLIGDVKTSANFGYLASGGMCMIWQRLFSKGRKDTCTQKGRPLPIFKSRGRFNSSPGSTRDGLSVTAWRTFGSSVYDRIYVDMNRFESERLKKFLKREREK